MAVVWGDQGAGAGTTGTSSVDGNYPTGISASTSVLYGCVISGHASDLTPTAPDGWTLIFSHSGGGGTYGLDSGPRRVSLYKKDVTTGSETGTATWTMATAGEMKASICRVEKTAGYNITHQTSGTEDASSGTSWSVTSASHALKAGALVFVLQAMVPDGATISGRSFTATGMTFNTRITWVSATITTGNDFAAVVDVHEAATGSTTTTMTYSHTSSINVTGVAAFVVLTESAAAIVDVIGGGTIPFPR